MKKSKLIVPAALAVMLLSTAASVTGTVAWFTSNKAVNTTLSSFTASSVGGNLTLTMTSAIGTENGATYTDDGLIVVKSGVKLTDGSYDASDGTLYRTPYKATEPATAGDNFVAIASNAASDKTQSGDGTYTRTVGATTYYFAVTWEMQFDYKFQGDTSNVNLYFNLDETETVSNATKKKSRIDSVQAVAAEGSHTEQTYKGFRIAFVGKTGSTAKTIWAPEQTSTNVKRISSVTTALAGVAQDSGVKVLASDTTPGVLSTADTGANTANNYLGTFVGSGTPVTRLVFTCTAWFEGTDPNVINEAEMDTVTAHMHFFVATNA